MAVYVDALMNWGWRLGASCHLIADSVEELTEFAKSIGMKEKWLQSANCPHFDLTAKRRAAALKLGAIQLNRKDFVAKMREIKNKNYGEIHQVADSGKN